MLGLLHAWAVISLVAQLRNGIARRPASLRALLCLLVLGLLLSGVPTGVVHAHGDAEPGHGHVHEHSHAHEFTAAGDELSPMPGDEDPASPHFHEAVSVTPALADPVAPIMASLPPMAWHPRLPSTGPRLSSRTPPHRPPIA